MAFRVTTVVLPLSSLYVLTRSERLTILSSRVFFSLNQMEEAKEVSSNFAFRSSICLFKAIIAYLVVIVCNGPLSSNSETSGYRSR